MGNLELSTSVVLNAICYFPDIDECAPEYEPEIQPICHQNADCVNTAGSYICICKDGFFKEASSCYGRLYFFAILCNIQDVVPLISPRGKRSTVHVGYELW